MISSMTGFGISEFSDDEKFVCVEIRAVNNRFLNTKIKGPDFLKTYEQEIENQIKKKITRGFISLIVTYKAANNNKQTCNINLDNLKMYYKMLEHAKEEIGLNGDIPLQSLLNFPCVMEYADKEKDNQEPAMKLIYDLMAKALDNLAEMRLRAGKDIKTEIENRGKQILELLNEVELRIPKVIENYSGRLHERIAKLLKGADILLSKDDLCREVAIFADRSDITEEISLFRSHIGQLCETMKEGGEAGKKLEFIIQEMFREANTMGSKSNDEKMLKHIFNVKTEIEKIRELALNIE